MLEHTKIMPLKLAEVSSGAFLRRIRNGLDMTQKGLAKHLHISLITLKRYEGDKRPYTTAVLPKLHELLEERTFSIYRCFPGQKVPLNVFSEEAREQFEGTLDEIGELNRKIDNGLSKKPNQENADKLWDDYEIIVQKQSIFLSLLLRAAIRCCK